MYGAFVVIVFWHTRATWARTLAVVVYAFVVAAVAWARLYQGMHFVSDVATGAVLGLWSLTICLLVLGPPDRDERESATRLAAGEHGADPVAQQRVDDAEVATGVRRVLAERTCPPEITLMRATSVTLVVVTMCQPKVLSMR